MASVVRLFPTRLLDNKHWAGNTRPTWGLLSNKSTMSSLSLKLNVGADFLHRLYFAIHQAFRVMVPFPHDRIPWTTQTLPYAIAPFIPFFFMAYLVRRRDTFLIRLLLLPSIIAISVRVAYGYYWTDPRLNVYNWGQSRYNYGISFCRS